MNVTPEEAGGLVLIMIIIALLAFGAAVGFGIALIFL